MPSIFYGSTTVFSNLLFGHGPQTRKKFVKHETKNKHTHINTNRFMVIQFNFYGFDLKKFIEDEQ